MCCKFKDMSGVGSSGPSGSGENNDAAKLLDINDASREFRSINGHHGKTCPAGRINKTGRGQSGGKTDRPNDHVPPPRDVPILYYTPWASPAPVQFGLGGLHFLL